MDTAVTLSSARIRPVRSTSRHELRIIWFGVAFCALALIPLFERGLAREWSSVCLDVAGVAFVYFAQSEATAWRRPLTLGHQLVFWWLWFFVLPVFALVTRRRRSRSLTLLLEVPFLVGSALLTYLFIRDLRLILP